MALHLILVGTAVMARHHQLLKHLLLMAVAVAVVCAIQETGARGARGAAVTAAALEVRVWMQPQEPQMEAVAAVAGDGQILLLPEMALQVDRV
jgi:hypothetical protein